MLQHGVSPLSDAAPTVTIAVDDGFPGGRCAQTHTFGAYAIGTGAAPSPPPAGSAEPSPGSAQPSPIVSGGASFPVWEVAAGIGLALVAVGGMLAGRRSRAARTAH